MNIGTGLNHLYFNSLEVQSVVYTGYVMSILIKVSYVTLCNNDGLCYAWRMIVFQELNEHYMNNFGKG